MKKLKNRKLALIIALLLVLGAINSNAITASAKTYTSKYKKTKIIYSGTKSPVTSNWITRKTTNYSSRNMKTKYRKNYTYEKRNKRKQYTYRYKALYNKGGKKIREQKFYANYDYLNGKWSFKNYRKILKNKNGNIYYDYSWTKRTNGKIKTKIVLNKGIKKRYNYNINGIYISTEQWKDGQWVRS